MKRLATPVSRNIDDHIGKLFFGEKDDRKVALQELFNWICSRPDLNAILLHHNRSLESLDGIYSQLVLAGAGQWAGGSFVAAAALAHPDTLRYLLRTADVPLPEGWSEWDRWLQMSFDLVEHFSTGRPIKENFQI